ncbi:MAG: aminotransferase class IV [Phycisphaerae bacterium]
MDIKRIAMWSGPRNISTAMMRSWGNRADTLVCDEPLYAPYLLTHGFDHPGREEILAGHETDWRKVSAWLTGPVPDGRSIFYQKHMAHHLLPHIERDWLDELTHCFLIREPKEMLTSLLKKIDNPTLADTGLPQQIEIMEHCRAKHGVIPPIIDSKDVLQNPEGMLNRLCEALGVPFDPAMLSWEPGRRDTDGVWAPYWYDAVEASTGFGPYRAKDEDVPSAFAELLAAADACYEQLFADRISLDRPIPTSLSPSPSAVSTVSEVVERVVTGNEEAPESGESHVVEGANASGCVEAPAEPVVADRSSVQSTTFVGSSQQGTGMLQTFNQKNRDILISINGTLHRREDAGISPFDSVVQGGDAVWEGLRLYKGRIFRLYEHLDRLRDSAKALAFTEIPDHAAIAVEIRRTLEANDMYDGVHIRLTLTRGEKITSGMDPRLNQSGPTLIVLAEHKPPVYGRDGLSLITSSWRRFPPDCLDPKIHHNNLIQSILAKIEANVAGADDALMLDRQGFVAETNATHVFLVQGGRVVTSRDLACPEGITRAAVMGLCEQHGIPYVEKDISMTEVYRADEAFCTGTMGELAPVTTVDGRVIGTGEVGVVTQRLCELYAALVQSEGEAILSAART